MFDTRTQACSPSAPLATLSWPHNVTIGGTEVERGRCLFVRNTVARNRERNERTLKCSVESSMATAIPAIEGGRPNLFGGFSELTNDSSLSGFYGRARNTVTSRTNQARTHKHGNTRPRTHKRERERKRKRSLSRSRDRGIVAVRTERTSSRSQSLLATGRGRRQATPSTAPAAHKDGHVTCALNQRAAVPAIFANTIVKSCQTLYTYAFMVYYSFVLLQKRYRHVYYINCRVII